MIKFLGNPEVLVRFGLRCIDKCMVDIKRYYEILGLQPGASQADVKQAYRHLAKQWHPDRFAHDPQLRQQAEARIKDINLAYQYLKNYQPDASPTAVPSSSRTGRSHTEVSSRPTGAEAIYYQGVENAKAGRYKEALDDFSVAIRLNPHHAEAYRYRGFVHSMLGFELGAEADLKKAKELGLGQTQSDRDLGEDLQQQAKRWGFFKRHPQRPSPSPAATPKQATPAPSPPTTTNVPTWKCRQTLTGQAGAIQAIALSHDGRTLASGSEDASIAVWNLRLGRLVCPLTGHTGSVEAIAMTGNGQLLISGSTDQTIKLWHLRTGELLRTLKGHTGAVRSLAISTDQHLLVSGSDDGTVRVWNLSNGKLLHILDEHNAPVWAVALSPDGRMILSGGEAPSLKLHHLKSGELMRKLATDAHTIFTIAMSGDNRHFVTGDSNGQVKLWDDRSLVTGSPLGAFSGHGGMVQSVTFSPDGQTIASGSTDHTIKLWHRQTQQLMETLTEHHNGVTSLAFAFDGQTLFSGSRDRTVRIWSRGDR